MSSQGIIHLLRSSRKLNLLPLVHRFAKNDGGRLYCFQTRQLSSKPEEPVYKSQGLHDAKYPEQEMTEIIRRVAAIEGKEIERRRQWNALRNFSCIVVIFLTVAVASMTWAVWLAHLGNQDNEGEEM